MEVGGSEKAVRCSGAKGNPTDLRSHQRRRCDAHYSLATLTPTRRRPPSFLLRFVQGALSATVAATAATLPVDCGGTYLRKLGLREQG